jgi:DNA-binding response OmpR family regulator
MFVRIIEDHPDIGELLRLELSMAGFAVEWRSSHFGDLLNAERWDGVQGAVFDLQLGDPDVTGGDIVLFVAEHAPHIRRVILSASPEADLTPELRAAAHVVMDKPTGIGKLAEALRGR